TPFTRFVLSRRPTTIRGSHERLADHLHVGRRPAGGLQSVRSAGAARTLGPRPPRRGLIAAYGEGIDELSDEVITFLSEGTRTGKLGYRASDGRPLIAPVWF